MCSTAHSAPFVCACVYLQVHTSTIQLWTDSTDKKLKVNKPPVTSLENAKLKDKDLDEDYLSSL